MKALVNIAENAKGTSIIPTVWNFEQVNQLYRYLNDCLKQGAINCGAMNKHGEELFPCTIQYELSTTTITRTNIMLTISEMTDLLMNGWIITNYYDENDPQRDLERMTRRVCKINEMR